MRVDPGVGPVVSPGCYIPMRKVSQPTDLRLAIETPRVEPPVALFDSSHPGYEGEAPRRAKLPGSKLVASRGERPKMRAKGPAAGSRRRPEAPERLVDQDGKRRIAGSGTHPAPEAQVPSRDQGRRVFRLPACFRL